MSFSTLAPRTWKRWRLSNRHTPLWDVPNTGGEYRKTRKPDGSPPTINLLDFSGYDGLLTVTYTWNNGDSHIVQGDALQVMQTMPDSCISLVYADPPCGS